MVRPPGGLCAYRGSLASIRRAIEAKAHVAEVDVRTTKDGVLVCLHDPEVDRTTDGTGKVADLTLAAIKKLDAGVKFDAKFKGERVPTLREILELAKGKIGVMIDLKEDDEKYAKRLANRSGSLGSRSVSSWASVPSNMQNSPVSCFPKPDRSDSSRRRMASNHLRGPG